MGNSNEIEQKFFTYLQKQFSKNDLIRLSESFVPNRSSNRVNRFYSNNNSIWFSRLNVSDNKKIYYLGVMEDTLPKAIVTYDKDYSKSGIRFSNDEDVYLRIYVDSENFEHLNDLFTLKYASKDKTSNNYYVVLGRINSYNLIKNIKTLIKRFNFKRTLKKKTLEITGFIEEDFHEEIGETVDKTDYVNVLKSNMKVIQIENAILKKNLPYSTVKSLKEYLFSQNHKNDYTLNSNFKNEFNLTDDEIFEKLFNTFSKSDVPSNYEDIVERISHDLKTGINDSPVNPPEEVDGSKSELEKMNIVIKAILEDKQYSEAAELAGISEDKIYEWYDDGENSISENTIYFFNILNEILFEESYDDFNEENDSAEENTPEQTSDEIEDDDSAEDDFLEQIFNETDDDTSEHESGENVERNVYRFHSYLFKPGIDVYQEAIDNFPLEVPRPDQLEIISEAAYAINKGYKYIIIEAGTGAGKSAIAATLARIYENSYILTVTKQLQAQYYDDFKKYGFKLVKGRQNFDCIRHRNVSCDKGDCVLKNKSCDYNLTGSNPLEKLESACKDYFWKSDTHCPYWVQKVEGLNSKVTIANYDFGLYDFNLSHYFKRRKLLILDEAHNLESKIMSFISLNFNRKTLKKDIGLDLDYSTIDRLQKGNSHDWISFVKHVKEKYDNRAKILINQAKSDGEDEGFIKDLEKELKIQSANRERFITYISNDKNNWICDYDNRSEIISFKPLSVRNYTHDYLFGFGEVCIFMSATILNHKKFAQWMGIDIKEVYSIKKDSPFDSANNPIIIKDSYNMSRGNLSENAPKTIPVLNEILQKHKNEKGLIHTVSKDCRRYIMKHIDDNRLMTHTTKNRHKKLEEYKSSKNSVLVSPSMSEGVDLPGEQCRFQVIYKLPFMTLSEQVRKRVQEDEEWYDYRTCISLVQTFGRGIRFEGDYCTTYVVDSRFNDFIRKDKKENHFIPDYVLDAIK